MNMMRWNPQTFQCKPALTPAGDFLVSAPRTPVAPGQVVTIGLWDKYGHFPTGADVQARVIGPGGTSTTAMGFLSNDWLNLDYPTAFEGAEKVYPSGTYTIVWSTDLDSEFLACDGFVVG